MEHAGQWPWLEMTIPRKELVWAGEALGRHIRIEATSGF